jgi:hypothetical protein
MDVARLARQGPKQHLHTWGVARLALAALTYISFFLFFLLPFIFIKSLVSQSENIFIPSDLWFFFLFFNSPEKGLLIKLEQYIYRSEIF